MDITEHAALRAVIVHETCDTIKQLQNELRREKQAHKRTRDEYESLKDCQEAIHRSDYMIFQCDHCHKWTLQYEPERMHASAQLKCCGSHVRGAGSRCGCRVNGRRPGARRASA